MRTSATVRCCSRPVLQLAGRIPGHHVCVAHRQSNEGALQPDMAGGVIWRKCCAALWCVAICQYASKSKLCVHASTTTSCL